MNTKVRVCHECGEQVEGSALYCPRCGVDVSGQHTLAATVPLPTTGEGDAPRIQATMRQTLRDATLGEYEILAELGRGGMATVFLAHDIALDRKVAIKVMAPHLLEGEGMVDRFKLEARTAAQLSHPHIIPIYAVRETESTIFFVMKFIEGRGLDTIIKKLGPLPIPMVKDILTKVGGALGYAHRRDVVHRDVKPSNVMIDEEGTPIMTDFGIAKVAEAQGLTMTGTTIGTPSFMSPEQCEGRPVTGASDQYSLGIVAFEMLTGKLPFVGESAVSTMYKHCHEELPPLHDFRPDCPQEVVDTVTRMLAKAPADRWPSLEAAVQKLGTQSLGYFDPVRTQLMELAKEGGYRDLLAQIQTPKSPVPRVRGQRTGDATAQEAPTRSRGWAAAAAAVLVLGGAGTLAVLQPWNAAGPSTEPVGGAETGTPPTTQPGGGAPSDAGGQAEVPTTTGDSETTAGGPEQPAGGGVANPPTQDGTPERQPAADPPPPNPTTQPTTRPAAPAPAAISTVRFGPVPGEVVAGQTVTLSATPFDAGGAALTNRTITWTSDDQSVARVSVNGVVTAVSAGEAIITASVEGVSTRHALTVLPVPVASVLVSPTQVALQAGGSQTLSAQARAQDGSALQGRSVRWSSSDESIVRVSASGDLTAVSAGSTTVIATVDDVTGRVTVTVEVDTRTALDALIDAYAQALESGDIQQVRAAYPGLTAAESEQLRQALAGMRNLDAVLSIGRLDEQAAQTDAYVSGTYSFVNAANGRQERTAIEFIATFERRGSAWVMTRTRND
jgi:serine/threonine-protein kinase